MQESWLPLRPDERWLRDPIRHQPHGPRITHHFFHTLNGADSQRRQRCPRNLDHVPRLQDGSFNPTRQAQKFTSMVLSILPPQRMVSIRPFQASEPPLRTRVRCTSPLHHLRVNPSRGSVHKFAQELGNLQLLFRYVDDAGQQSDC